MKSIIQPLLIEWEHPLTKEYIQCHYIAAATGLPAQVVIRDSKTGAMYFGAITGSKLTNDMHIGDDVVIPAGTKLSAHNPVFTVGGLYLESVSTAIYKCTAADPKTRRYTMRLYLSTAPSTTKTPETIIVDGTGVDFEGGGYRVMSPEDSLITAIDRYRTLRPRIISFNTKPDDLSIYSGKTVLLKQNNTKHTILANIDTKGDAYDTLLDVKINLEAFNLISPLPT